MRALSNLFAKGPKSRRLLYSHLFFLKEFVSRHQNLLERWSASLTACWTKVCENFENMSTKVEKHLWKKDLIKLKLFLPEKFFWACRVKAFNRADFFSKILFLSKGRKQKEKKIPRKLCSSTKSLRTRSLEFCRHRLNFLQNFIGKIRVKVRKKITKWVLWKKLFLLKKYLDA